jgi:hypothetical protein
MKLFNAQSKKKDFSVDLDEKKLGSEFLNAISGGWVFIPLPPPKTSDSKTSYHDTTK